ncbi:hypothetical protein D3C87_1984690 [compost metagenome]
MWPPCSSIRFLESESPRPKPPKARVALGSAWKKLLKSIGSFSGLIPMPESVTSTRTIGRPLLGSSRARSPTVPPGGVNLRALVSRCPRTW